MISQGEWSAAWNYCHVAVFIFSFEMQKWLFQYAQSWSFIVWLFNILTWKSAVPASFFQCRKQTLFSVISSFLTWPITPTTVLIALFTLFMFSISCINMSEHCEHVWVVSLNNSETCRSESVSLSWVQLEIRVKISVWVQAGLASQLWVCNCSSANCCKMKSSQFWTHTISACNDSVLLCQVLMFKNTLNCKERLLYSINCRTDLSDSAQHCEVVRVVVEWDENQVSGRRNCAVVTRSEYALNAESEMKQRLWLT